MSENSIIKLEGIHKSFPGVQALEGVDFTLNKGEIHALVGENGAGKSTMIKLMTGVEQPDQGRILLDGKETTIKSPQHAQQLGISPVFQEINLCTNLSVAENIMIGREPTKFGRIDWKAIHAHARQVVERLQLDVDVTQTLGSYSVAIQQMVAIARALDVASTRVLILDEPTSSLDANETRQLFGVMKRLKADGIGIVFITHFLDQVYEISDQITVLRNGKLVGSYKTGSISHMELIAKMIGRNLADYEDMKKTKLETSKHIKSTALLETKQLRLAGAIEPFDLQLHAGEVVGLAGLLGSGRTEIARLLFGIDQADGGSISVGGKTMKNYTPLDSIKSGVALCPEDRKADGIIGELTIRENIVLALQASQGWFRHISTQKQYEIADKYIKLLSIATPSADQLIKNLSGGNQQKVILARWLATNPQVLILDEPTRGIDVGAKAEIQKLVLSLAADEGKACVFISSELEEVLRTSHRIVVLKDHEKVSEFSGEVSEQKIMHAMAGD